MATALLILLYYQEGAKSITEEQKPKRKTRTSSAVKNRYNAKTYKNYRAAIKPDLFERIEKYSKQENLSRPEFLQRAIETLDK